MRFAEQLASTIEAEGIGRSCRVAEMKKLLDGQDSSRQTPPCNVVVLCDAFFDQATSPGEGAWIPRYTDALCEQLLKFVQSLLPATPTGSPPASRLWIVTRGAVTIEDGPGAAARDIQSNTTSALRGLVQAPLWGLGKVVALEEPRLRTTLVDLPASPTSISLETEALIAELRENDGEEQIALRVVAEKSESNGRVGRMERFVSRLSPQSLSVTVSRTQDQQTLPLGAEGAYLITGGLGALGLACARFLVEEGARSSSA